MRVLGKLRTRIGCWLLRLDVRWWGWRFGCSLCFRFFPARVGLGMGLKGRAFPREFRAGLSLGPLSVFVGGYRDPAFIWQRYGMRLRPNGTLDFLVNGEVVATAPATTTTSANTTVALSPNTTEEKT